MIIKSMAVLAIVAVMAGGIIARDDITSIEVGDNVILRMSGELAVEYARRTGYLNPDEKPPRGLQIETSVIVCQMLENGQYRVELSAPFVNRDKKACLVTLTSIVDAKQFTQYVIRKGPAYASPADSQKGVVKPVQIEEDRQGVRLELSDLKGLKLRTWSLTEEFGEGFLLKAAE